MKIKELNEKQRLQVIRLHNQNKSSRKIAKELKFISYKGAQKIIKKYKEHKIITNLPRTGRPKPTTERENRLIKLEVLKDDEVTAEKIKENLNLNVSPSTIRRRLNSFGLFGRIARNKPKLSSKNKASRFEFAKEHLNKPMDFWRKIIWSDESKFEMFSRRRKRIWRKKNEAFAEGKTKTTMKHCPSVMVWGCFSALGLGNLVEITTTMDQKLYMKILEDNLECSADLMGIKSDFVFQQNNDPKHTALAVRKWFDDFDVDVLKWPSQSPDLNPIEHLWDELDRTIPKNLRRNIKNFKKALFDCWSTIGQQVLDKLVDSMPRRLQAVIDARGGHTKY